MIYKPTDDAYLLQAPVENGLAVATGLTVCCWVRFRTLGRRNTIFRVLNVGVRGWVFRSSSADKVELFYVGDGGGGNLRAHTPASALVTTKWYHFYASVDAAGDSVVGLDAEQTTAAGDVLSDTGAVLNPTILHHELGTVGHGGLCEIADLQIFDRALLPEERAIIRSSEGTADIVKDRKLRLAFFDAAAGIDTDAVLPQCTTDPSRSWSVVDPGGTDAYVYGRAPYPRRRAA